MKTGKVSVDFIFDFVIEKNKDEQVYSLKKYASCLRATHPFDSLIEKGRQQSLPLSGKRQGGPFRRSVAE